MPLSTQPAHLPAELEPLSQLAFDLRWTWSHAGDRLWRQIDAPIWNKTRNPWTVLQNVPPDRLQQLARSDEFRRQLDEVIEAHRAYLADPGWYGKTHTDAPLKQVAYFSMEFGLGEGLELYAGGLGILAGDYLKTASDLGIPVVGIGLLYQEGYFRQVLDAAGQQVEAYPYNDPTSLPIQPVQTPSDGWLRIRLDLPGRALLLRVWEAYVGRTRLYLLDSNDPLNSPADRGITSKLYGGGDELRLMQEVVLGVAGWRLVEALKLQVDVCHINEGHAAFVVVERARSFMSEHGVTFHEALWATRPGNVFTTHTPVAAGFDRFGRGLVQRHMSLLLRYITELGVSTDELLALGRVRPDDDQEPFNMAYLAMRGCGTTNAVSRLHGEVSRDLFRPLYSRWPEQEVPVTHVTNGVHVPSWDSPWADKIWTAACGKERWLGSETALADSINCLSDEELWTFSSRERQDLVAYARERLARQLGQAGADETTIAEAANVLDPNILTFGFARRFVEYKRPNLLLYDPARLVRLLTNAERPVQLLVAGKAHPADQIGRQLIRQWSEFARRPDVRHRVIFLEDYDIALAQELVQGVDVWINTPRRPWEACGTSGMKVLVNGGLNLSELDGWWAEAYAEDVGWALGDGKEHDEAGWDAVEAKQLYELLEQRIVPEFYARDAAGIPRAWVARMRTSLSQLAPRFSSNRMAREYVEQIYFPAALGFARRTAEQAQLGKALWHWAEQLRQHWHSIHFGTLEITQGEQVHVFGLPLYFGDLEPDSVKVELYCEASGHPEIVPMVQDGPVPGAINGYFFRCEVASNRAPESYTPRVVAWHPEAILPTECPYILWYR